MPSRGGGRGGAGFVAPPAHVDASLIHEFRAVTGADASHAERALRLAGGNLESAIDYHFSVHQTSEPGPSSLPAKRLTQPNLHAAKRPRVNPGTHDDTSNDLGTKTGDGAEPVGGEIHISSLAASLENLIATLPKRPPPDSNGWQVSLPQHDECFVETAGATLEWAAATLNAHTTGKPFMDKAFPASASSIDGKGKASSPKGENERIDVDVKRNEKSRRKELEEPTEPDPPPDCHCALPCVTKEVGKEGPNQGRYFFGCGGGESINRFAKRREKSEKIASPKKEKEKCGFFAWADFAPSSESAKATRWRRFTPPRFKLSSSATDEQSRFKPCDVRQGAVGDCWLLSALAVVAERADLVERLLVVKSDGLGERRHVDSSSSTICQQLTRCSHLVGAHLVRLFIDGKWRGVLVDPVLPVRGIDTVVSTGANKAGSRKKRNDDDDFQPAFSRASKNQLWVPLLEKAHAKLHGSYHAISGGWIAEGLFDLTGCPTETVRLDSSSSDETKESIWQRLVSYASSGFPMGCATGWGTSHSGIVGGHAYSVMDVRELHGALVGRQTTIGETSRLLTEKADGIVEVKTKPNPKTNVSEPLRLVRVRNPWGRREWAGEWGTGSEVWTHKLATELGHVRADDGTFWMRFDDFRKRFQQVDVCKAHKGWFANSRECAEGSLPVIGATRHENVHTTHASAFELEVSGADDTGASTTDGPLVWGYLMALQNSKRGRRNGFWYDDLHVVVYTKRRATDSDKNDSVWTPVMNLHGVRERDAFAEIMFESGVRYLIRIYSFSREQRGETKETPQKQTKESANSNAMLRVYSARAVKLRPVLPNSMLPSLAPAVHLHLLDSDGIAANSDSGINRTSVNVCGGAVVVCKSRGGAFVFALNFSKARELTLKLAVRARAGTELFQHPPPVTPNTTHTHLFGKYVPPGEENARSHGQTECGTKQRQWATHSIPPGRARLVAVAIACGPSETKRHGLDVRVSLVGPPCGACASRASASKKIEPEKTEKKSNANNPFAEFGLPPPPIGTTDEALAAMLVSVIAEAAVRQVVDVPGDELRVVKDENEQDESESDSEVLFVKETSGKFGARKKNAPKESAAARAPPKRLATLFQHVPVSEQTKARFGWEGPGAGLNFQIVYPHGTSRRT